MNLENPSYKDGFLFNNNHRDERICHGII